MKSRAQLDREPRTVSFEVTQICPFECTSPERAEQYKSRFPLRISVHWNPGAPMYPSGVPKCDGKHYQISDESLIALGREPRVWVCEHMGRFIE